MTFFPEGIGAETSKTGKRSSVQELEEISTIIYFYLFILNRRRFYCLMLENLFEPTITFKHNFTHYLYPGFEQRMRESEGNMVEKWTK